MACVAFCVITFEPIMIQTCSAPQNDHLIFSFVKDTNVDVKKMTRNHPKMIKQTGDSLLLSKHSIQLSALFLLLSGSKAFFRELENIFWTCSRPRLIVFAVYGKWRNMTSICQFPGWGSHPSSFLPSIQSIDPIFYIFFFQIWYFLFRAVWCHI